MPVIKKPINIIIALNIKSMNINNFKSQINNFDE